MKKNVMFSLFLISIFVIGCDWNKEYDSIVPDYKSNKLWKVKINGDSFRMMPTQVGQYVYGLEPDADGKTVCLYKIDLEDGSFVWKTGPYDSRSVFSPLVHGDRIYVYMDKSIIFCFDEGTGKKIATIGLSCPDGNEDISMCSRSLLLTSDGHHFLWNYYKNNEICDDGILKVCFSDVDYNKDPEEKQTFTSEFIWKGSFVDSEWREEDHVYSNLHEENGLVYFLTSGKYSDRKKYRSKLGCIEIESGDIVWIRDMDGFAGDNHEVFYSLDENIYVFDSGLGCYEKATGDEVWSYTRTAQDMLTKVNLASLFLNYAGVYYDDGCFYYTTCDGWLTASMIGCDPSLVGNIKCLDAATGKLKWQYLPKGCGSLATRPVVIGNKVFVTTWGSGLYVFDKKTGKVIGADKTVENAGDDKNYEWNGNFIYFNYDYQERTRTLTCIRP